MANFEGVRFFGMTKIPIMKCASMSLQRCDWLTSTVFHFFRANQHTNPSHGICYTHCISYSQTLTIIRFCIMDKTPWYSNFPPPRSAPRTMTHEEVYALLTNPETMPGRDYLIVDVRRTDFGVYPSFELLLKVTG